MDDIIEQLTEAALGLSPEDITAQLEQCPNVLPEQVPVLAAWIASLAAA